MGEYGEHQENGLTVTKEERLEQRALREYSKGDWPIPEDQVPDIIARQVHIATSGEYNARESSRAAAVLVMMKKSDNEKLKALLDKMVPVQHEHTGTIEHEHRVTAKELLSSPDYVEWLRQRERDSDPRFVRANGHEGNGKPVDDGHTRNGHRP